MSDQPVDFFKSFQQGAGDAQTVGTLGKGVYGLGKLLISIVLLGLELAAGWGRCMMRRRAGTMMVLGNYVPGWILLNIVAGRYAHHAWGAVPVLATYVLGILILVEGVTAAIRSRHPRMRPVHRMSVGEPRAILRPIWRLLNGGRDASGLRIAMVYEPSMLLAAAAIVFALERSMWPAPDDRWAMSAVLALVGLCMAATTGIGHLRSHAQIVRLRDQEMEQHDLAEAMRERPAVRQDRGTEGLSSIPANERE